jgi:serine/threonine protein kinase
MTSRRNDKTAPPPKGEDGSAPDLLTSEDLFGDMIDAPPASAPRGRAVPPPAAARKGPIKVQVSEPGGGRKRSPLASPPAAGEKLPEDVAALLDAFSEPGESALREDAELDTMAPESSDIGLLVDEEAAPSAPAEEGEPAAGDGLLDHMVSGADEPPAVTPADHDEEVGDDVLLDVLSPVEDAPAPAEAAPPLDVLDEIEAPPPVSPAAVEATAGDPESLHDLMELGSPPAADDDDGLELMKPASRITTKFKAVAPRKDTGPAAGGLDLAALVEDAFATAEPPSATVDEPAASATQASADDRESEAEAAAAEAAASGGEPTPLDATPEPTSAAAAPASDYGPYQLLERVAVGGMAEVFRAKRTGVEGFEKVVAVKRILSHLSDNKEFVDMFIDEAKMVASLAHPNIVQIFDLGRHAKNYWIAMEYVHGRDLRTILRRAKDRNLRIPLDIGTYVASKVCAALEYAHRKKDDKGHPMLIVHRDISPQNILISFEGDVKLTDFGIAKAATKASTTDKGALRGKLLYMSPEQAWGKPMDKRSDVFSLGIVFYEMLTDQKPFLGTSEMSILETVRECRIPPPTTVNDAIPEKLERVVMKALERDPEVRYQDAGEMLRDLEGVLHEWQPASATALARFLELLFDEGERGDAVPRETAGDAHSDSPAAVEELREPTGPMPVEPPPAPVKDPMSIQKLLKRFGIK